MSGVEKLRARVEQLATEIVLQKELLKTLEKEKSLVQRELNAALDPVARLPLEISSKIFVDSLESFSDRKPNVEDAPMLLLRICNSWKNLALSTPDLWAGIQITFPCCAPGFKKGVQAWLDRASNRPLSISLCGPGIFDPGVTKFVWKYRQQLKHLDLCYQREEESDSDDEDPSRIDFLGDNPGLLPSLQTVVIRAVTPPNGDQGYICLQILELLRLAPNLIECSIGCASEIWGFGSRAELLAIPGLRRLSFTENSDDEILQKLTLPGLEAISLMLLGAAVNFLLSLLQRSSPPLRELDIVVEGVDSIELQQCLCLVPTLEKFEIWRGGSPLLLKFLTALAESPSLLPGLRSLTIHIQYDHDLDFDLSACWTVLLGALTSRQGQVRHVHVEWYAKRTDGRFKPTDDILSAFRVLAVGGMQLFIGSQDHDRKLNFI
ncbi:hypothetical protein C8R47DRAFT_1088394 [Mycena vitilis]|nr:hypothetical protein C8R47DRAFT_1088394 [Mycena vitilis]